VTRLTDVSYNLSRSRLDGDGGDQLLLGILEVSTAIMISDFNLSREEIAEFG
jgi:hypothetical protein